MTAALETLSTQELSRTLTTLERRLPDVLRLAHETCDVACDRLLTREIFQVLERRKARANRTK